MSFLDRQIDTIEFINCGIGVMDDLYIEFSSVIFLSNT